MKTAGLGDSVETRQAVAQLQEALGTIRVLQESLNESEAVNLEVDNLRSELANVMATQLNELQKTEEEKQKLQQKVNDLEAEIAIIREEGSQSGLAQIQVVADLNEKLASTEALVADLEQRLKRFRRSWGNFSSCIGRRIKSSPVEKPGIVHRIGKSSKKEEVKRLNCWKKSLLTRSIN